MTSRGTVWSPTLTCGVPWAKETESATPVWCVPSLSFQEMLCPSMVAAAIRICREKFSVDVLSMLVSFSMVASSVVWLIIWLVSMGEEGSWLRNWVTRRFMNTSESMDCLGARVGVVL